MAQMLGPYSTRPGRWSLVVVMAIAVLVAACGSEGGTVESSSSSVASADPAKADEIVRIVEDVMANKHLNAAIVRVTVDGREVITQAFGESMTGVPATTDMHFRNGAVAISYVAAVLLQLVDEGAVALDDTIEAWVPQIPNSDKVTLGQLATMTSGYQDYILGNDAFNDAEYANPFRAWTTDELLAFAVDKPLYYEPGTNWNYAHTNYVILGLALEEITGTSVAELIDERILEPLELTNTQADLTATIPEPTLHAFTSERREFFDIAPTAPFYEESTYWNPSWTITHGAIQTSNIYDVEATASKLFAGQTLSPESHQAMVSTRLRGQTSALPGCPTCRPMNEQYTYGMGVAIAGDWILQNPLFSGYAAVTGYLPSQKVAIAVAVTYLPEAFGPDGSYDNGGNTIFSRVGALMAPEDAPPLPRD
ncbi:beta-lactamase family protein [Gordonia mangrovi]|nr:serine hydrolase domain-containing protein [Gordonia mangrovi]UVF79627.1 beta-lactamase family protein [Gordonia mangrovi]